MNKTKLNILNKFNVDVQELTNIRNSNEYFTNDLYLDKLIELLSIEYFEKNNIKYKIFSLDASDFVDNDSYNRYLTIVGISKEREIKNFIITSFCFIKFSPILIKEIIDQPNIQLIWSYLYEQKDEELISTYLNNKGQITKDNLINTLRSKWKIKKYYKQMLNNTNNSELNKFLEALNFSYSNTNRYIYRVLHNIAAREFKIRQNHFYIQLPKK